MDSLLIREKMVAGQGVCLAVVCDGVGSLADGAYAASSAVRLLGQWMDSLTDTLRIGLSLRDTVLLINKKIACDAKSLGMQTASTLSALLLVESRYYIVHLGDSRIYSFQDGALEQLTLDQSSQGKLTAYLGRSENTSVQYNEGEVERKSFLVCTDGLYKKIDSEYLCAELSKSGRRNLKKTVGRLAEQAISRGETDNISLALVICESGR